MSREYLIARLQKLNGPDRKTDAMIECWLKFPDLRPAKADDHLEHQNGVPPGPGHIWCPTGFLIADYYTSSLTAARKLANGFYWVASEGKTRDSEPLGGAQIFRKNYLVKPVAEAEHEYVEIALCIAVLKALT